jgi:hypothetical protein
MKKLSPLFIIIANALILTAIIGPLVNPSASLSQAVATIEKGKIQQVIRSYFEDRYKLLSSSMLDKFPEASSDFLKGNPTLVQEIEKLEIQIAHAKKYHLVYSQYKYLLDFKQISFDPLTLMATVSLIEGHDVVFDISNKISPTSPITSSMRNLQHTIILQKESDEWKIKSDQYDDYLWRFLRTTGTNAKELQRLTDDERDLTDVPGDLNISATCSLPGDITSYSYDRYGAVAYAKVWATAPRPYNHPPFDDYTDFGGDCTNFVSQVIHIGGKANMFNPGNFGVGQPGWYYYSVQDRATAWNDVKALHDFITDYSVWLGGPEGCDVQQYEVLEGDIIQYNWTNDDYWDHSVLINRSEEGWMSQDSLRDSLRQA